MNIEWLDHMFEFIVVSDDEDQMENTYTVTIWINKLLKHLTSYNIEGLLNIVTPGLDNYVQVIGLTVYMMGDV